MTLACALAGTSACNLPTVLEVDHIAGERVDLWQLPDAPLLPVFLSGGVDQDACQVRPGPCSTLCTREPSQCAPTDCRALVLDSLAPLSTFVTPSRAEPAYVKRCATLRAPPNEQGDLAATRTRLRIFELGALELAQATTAPDNWHIQGPHFASGVLGGDFLLQFATEFRFPRDQPAQARFFRRLPGSSLRLANAGLAYLSAQAPGQFLGQIPGDHCELSPGLECDRPIAGLGGLETQQIMPPSRLQLDACMMPPPCTTRGDDLNEVCTRSIAERGEALPCPAWQDYGSSGASLLLATAVPGLVLFSDSAQRILGDPALLQDCSALTGPLPAGSLPACKDSTSTGSLSLPGWPSLHGLSKIKISSIGLLGGLSAQFGRNPCERWEQLQRIVRAQCQAFVTTKRNGSPSGLAQLEPDVDPSMLERSVFQAGELAFDNGSNLTPRLDRWLSVTILPSTAPLVSNLRRSSGSIAAEADGLLGLDAFDQTQLILDYTEQEDRPGLRVRCLEPQDQRCRSLPACLSDTDSEHRSCCYGIPPSTLEAVIRSSDPAQGPHPCCDALGESVRLEMTKDGLTVCNR